MVGYCASFHRSRMTPSSLPQKRNKKSGEWKVTTKMKGRARNADFQSAAPQTFSLRGPEAAGLRWLSCAAQTESLRYGRLKVCVTGFGLAAFLFGAGIAAAGQKNEALLQAFPPHIELDSAK